MQKITLYWKKLNVLSENLRFDSKFVLVFETWQVKVGFSFFFFKYQFFKALPGWMGQNTFTLLSEKNKIKSLASNGIGSLLHISFTIYVNNSIQQLSFIAFFHSQTLFHMIFGISFTFVAIFTLRSVSTCFISVNLPFAFLNQ